MEGVSGICGGAFEAVDGVFVDLVERTMPVRLLSRIVLAVTASVSFAQLASAHAKLVNASPAIGGVARSSPRELDLTFSEEVSGPLTGATVKFAGTASVPATASVDKSGKTLVLKLATALKRGVYVVDWHAVASDDGHRTTGTYKFSVL